MNSSGWESTQYCSGAVDTIAPKDMVKGNKIRQTDISKRNGKYASADGGIIQSIGECEIEGVAHDGTEIKLVTQVRDKLTNMLIAVRRVVESGNMVVFGANMKAIRKLAACEKSGKHDCRQGWERDGSTRREWDVRMQNEDKEEGKRRHGLGSGKQQRGQRRRGNRR